MGEAHFNVTSLISGKSSVHTSFLICSVCLKNHEILPGPQVLYLLLLTSNRLSVKLDLSRIILKSHGL